jgi:hypothetical protein
MKYFMICFLFFVAACSSSNNNSALDGVYTASFEHEFAKTEDTLILKKANDGNGVYQITRHSGVIKKLDGKVFPKEILTDTWTLEYNADKQTLTELKEGKILVWDSNRLTLQFGATAYKKISGL